MVTDNGCIALAMMILIMPLIMRLMLQNPLVQGDHPGGLLPLLRWHDSLHFHFQVNRHRIAPPSPSCNVCLCCRMRTFSPGRPSGLNPHSPPVCHPQLFSFLLEDGILKESHFFLDIAKIFNLNLKMSPKDLYKIKSVRRPSAPNVDRSCD